jgi:hypothetical protein
MEGIDHYFTQVLSVSTRINNKYSSLSLLRTLGGVGFAFVSCLNLFVLLTWRCQFALQFTKEEPVLHPLQLVGGSAVSCVTVKRAC